MDELATLRQENAELGEQLAKLFELVAKLNERSAELVPAAQRRQRRPTVPETVPPPVVDADAQAAFEPRPKAPEKPPKEEKPKKPAPTGRTPRHPALATTELRRFGTVGYCSTTCRPMQSRGTSKAHEKQNPRNPLGFRGFKWSG